MHTKDFSIFCKMLNIAKQKNVEYIIMYSYHPISSGNYPHSYSFVLSTNLFTVTFYKKYEEGNDNAIKDFIRYNECIELDFELKFDKDYIELH